MNVIKTDGQLIINGKKVEIPSHLKASSMSIIDNKLFIDGYEVKEDGSCKKTLRALYHKYF